MKRLIYAVYKAIVNAMFFICICDQNKSASVLIGYATVYSVVDSE